MAEVKLRREGWRRREAQASGLALLGPPGGNQGSWLAGQQVESGLSVGVVAATIQLRVFTSYFLIQHHSPLASNDSEQYCKITMLLPSKHFSDQQT